MGSKKIPLDIIGQEIIPGDLVVIIHSKGRGSESSVQVVTEIKSKSVIYGLEGMERSVKCLKVTEEQAMNHNLLNYANSPVDREYKVKRKINHSRELKEEFGR